MKRFTFSTTL